VELSLPREKLVSLIFYRAKSSHRVE